MLRCCQAPKKSRRDREYAKRAKQRRATHALRRSAVPIPPFNHNVGKLRKKLRDAEHALARS